MNELYTRIAQAIQNFMLAVFLPPTGIELNASDWERFREIFAEPDAQHFQRIPVTVTDGLEPGQFRLLGHEDRWAQLETTA